MAKFTKKDALLYHSDGRPGKIKVIPTTPHGTQRDLSLAYSPGVAEPCLDIKDNPDDVFKYTAKGNLVAVISNETAVLGLGDIGHEAGKPVMEGKGLLFEIFANIDVFDIELDKKNVDRFIDTVKCMSPTFGGINIEDIKAPECFEIEERLKNEFSIPVMHDNQHGTAIISAAGLLNALEITGKKIDEINVVVNGAGASAIYRAKLYISLGVPAKNIVMCDSKGVIHKDRAGLNKYKQQFATSKEIHTLDAMRNADVFLGLSVGNVVSKDMIRLMADNPIVFAMTNPDPEIAYEDAMDARNDLIMATGRSDYPNQINNVLGFPFIFRGALDVRASTINEEMKIAAAKALAKLAKEPVPETVNAAYKEPNIVFGKEYIIPKPLDPRHISTIAPAVAEAAINLGVARNPITNWDKYKEELNKRLGLDNKLLRSIIRKAKSNPARVVFAEANHFNVLKAAQVVAQDNIAHPILLGDETEINKLIEQNKLGFHSDIEIIDPKCREENERRKQFAEILSEKRQRKGLYIEEATDQMYHRNYFGNMMVETGEADCLITGFDTNYKDALKADIEITGTREDVKNLASVYLMMTKKDPFFFADTAVNKETDSITLVETTILTAETVRKYNIEPCIALLSFSNFGSVRTGNPAVVQEAVRILHHNYPKLCVEGEMQADFAFNAEIRNKKFPFNKLADKQVNTLIFPNLDSGNIAYKMMQSIGEAVAIGSVLMGMNKAIQIVQLESSTREMIDMIAIAVVDAQEEIK